jgi:hypothetical protein
MLFLIYQNHRHSNILTSTENRGAHPNYRHGLRTVEMQELRRLISYLSKGARELS